MSKKTVAVVLVALVIIAVTGVLFLNREPSPSTPTTTETSSISETSNTPALETESADDMQFDESSEETRIILLEPDDEKLNELLSDKVIRDDKIVDKSEADTP